MREISNTNPKYKYTKYWKVINEIALFLKMLQPQSLFSICLKQM